VPPVLPPPDSNGYIDIGNPDLRADRATDMDAGYEHIFGDDRHTRASIDVYRTDLRTPSQQYIPPHRCSPGSHTPPSECLSFPINVGGAVYQGIEARAERDLSGSLHARAAYGITSAFPTSVAAQFQNGSLVPGEQFEGVPLHKGTLSVERNATGDGLAYSAGVVYESANNELNRPAFATVHAGVTWTAKELAFGLYGDNLTNVYDDRFTLALQGRSVTFVITRRL
jgi:outer membrane receptor for ferrienterochelin and colicin